MKKLMLLVLVVGLSLPTFAKLKEKDVIGTWKYRVETDQGDLTGSIEIVKSEGNLVGQVFTDDGETFTFSKIEIKEDNTLYLELDTGSDLLVISVSVKKKKMEGTVSTQGVSFPMTSEKSE